MADPMCGAVYLPGDILGNLKTSESTGKSLIGPGLQRKGDQIVVAKPGILKHREPNFYWIDTHQKRYVPVRGDSVIGIVSARAGDIFRVDIGGSDQATLPFLAFEGATKKNRPNVKIGDVIYAKCVVANKDMEPELVCIGGDGKAGGMGVIRDGGFIFQASLNLVRKILSTECTLLKTLGRKLPYEIAIGMNGRIWIKGRSTQETVAIMNAISLAEYMNNEQITVMVKKIINTMHGFET